MADTSVKPLPWLLEADPINPGVRYFVLRDLLDRPPDDRDVRQAQAAVMATGPVPQILAAQAANGSWGTSADENDDLCGVAIMAAPSKALTPT